ncbi:MAG: hypothetical protein U0M15_01360 [Bacillota bacterium]|nr:hypothetical protein [Bacillota bacterium]
MKKRAFLLICTALLGIALLTCGCEKTDEGVNIKALKVSAIWKPLEETGTYGLNVKVQNSEGSLLDFGEDFAVAYRYDGDKFQYIASEGANTDVVVFQNSETGEESNSGALSNGGKNWAETRVSPYSVDRSVLKSNDAVILACQYRLKEDMEIDPNSNRLEVKVIVYQSASRNDVAYDEKELITHPDPLGTITGIYTLSPEGLTEESVVYD